MTASPNSSCAPPVPADVVDAIRAMNSPVIISHVVPDADALGSSLALAGSLQSDDCRPTIALPIGSLSQRLEFLFDMVDVPVATDADFAAADGFVALDTAKKPRCNVGKERKEGDWTAGRTLVNIDHHATNTCFGDVNWVVGTAGSTCEILYYLLRAMDVTITPTTASLLYAGIQTDTLGFSLPNTGTASLQAGADLLAAGADIADLGERLLRSQSVSEFNLLRVIYRNTKTEADGHIAYSHANHDEIHDAGCTAADIDDQISVPRSLDGVRLAMLFTEGHKGKTRINFRGSGSVTVVELAKEFHGGGHTQAAGAILNCPIEEAIEQVLPRAIEHLKHFPP